MPLLRYAAERRKRLLEALDGLEAELVELNRRVEEEVWAPVPKRWMVEA